MKNRLTEEEIDVMKPVAQAAFLFIVCAGRCIKNGPAGIDVELCAKQAEVVVSKVEAILLRKK